MSDSRVRGAQAPHVPRPIATTLLAWLTMLGVDLFLHAGVLAPLYDWDSPFLLSPEQAFVRIPVGWAAYLLLAVALAWVIPRLGIRRGGEGALAAAVGGAVVWGAMTIGLWSISTAAPALLTAWWLAQTAGLASGGYIAGAALGGARLRRLVVPAIASVVVGAVSAVILQSIGYAPSPS